MEAAMTKRDFKLFNLCCPVCAGKIQKNLNKLDGVTSAVIDFSSQKLTVELAGGGPEDVAAKIAVIAKRYESAIEVAEIFPAVPGEKTLYLANLPGAEHAEKIEARVKSLEGVSAVSVDYAAQKMRIEAVDRVKLPFLLRQASDIVKEIDPNIEISFSERHGADESRVDWKRRLSSAGLCVGAALFFAGMYFKFDAALSLGVFVTAYLLVGGSVVLRSLKNIAKGQLFDENFLMSVATFGAFAIGEYAEGVAVMLFYQVGEAFQRMAVNRSRKSISALMDIRPDFANLKCGAELRRVSPEEVGVGEHIVVKPGEKVPLDGVVIEGRSALDTSALTGESAPRDIEPGGSVMSGSINKSGLLTIKVAKEFGESTVSKILDLVQNAGSKKAPVENFITKFARYYTPAVVFVAIALAVIPPLFLPGANHSEWIRRALVFLVVSCPCALVISIPLGFFGGIGGASRCGILVKGSNYLEALSKVDAVVFDKTGTLTKGVFSVTKIVPVGMSEDKLLFYAAHAESESNHPIAVSIRKAYGRRPQAERISEYEEVAGYGVKVRIGGDVVLAGNEKLLYGAGVSHEKAFEPGTVVYLAVNGVFAGYVVISDELKPDSARAVKDLKKIGVAKTVMLTGDSRAVGERVGGELGIDEVYAELLPQQKVERLEEIDKDNAKGKVVFVGDGINDAPVLARSDIGVAMGGVGSDAAIEAADIVLMTDEPSKIVDAIRIAKKTRTIVWQNIIFSLGVKGVILVLGAIGMASMWEAVFGDVGVTLIAVLNSMRAMRAN
ncbi:MAG: cadmium-translocating P-type ATPase [Synergistaceae bacterium]|jgi:Cd2+/Zn2+-exporting ATPase|nr:cadmium-translocating P-type ATPase [Synergistaceae bacterium]